MPVLAQDRPSPVAAPVDVEPLLRTGVTTSGDPIRAPQGRLQLVASTYRIAPGAALPVHRHPFPRYGYVLSGRLIVTNVETQRSTPFGAGAMIVEDVGRWHEARNPGTQPVELLVIDLVEPAAGNLILRDDGQPQQQQRPDRSRPRP